MEHTSVLIVNGKLSSTLYFQRRSSYLDKMTTAPYHVRAKAITTATALFGNKETLSFQKIREKELDTKIGTTDLADFRGIAQLRQVTFSLEDYQNVRMNSAIRHRAIEQADRDRLSIFSSHNVNLKALEILQKELEMEITPLLPLPTTQNLETVDGSSFTGDQLPLSSVSHSQ